MRIKLREKVIVASRSKHLNIFYAILVLICILALPILKSFRVSNLILQILLAFLLILLLSWRTLYKFSKTPPEVLYANNLVFIALSDSNVLEWYLDFLIFVPLIYLFYYHWGLNIFSLIIAFIVFILASLLTLKISKYFKDKLSDC